MSQKLSEATKANYEAQVIKNIHCIKAEQAIAVD